MLSQIPLGICLIGADEQIQWANPVLCDQLGITNGDLENAPFGELPMQAAADQGNDIYRPMHRPQLRLRASMATVEGGLKIVVFTDVSDLVSDYDGYVNLLREAARTDADTGLLTTVSVYRELFAQLARSQRYGNTLAIIRIRIDGLQREEIGREQSEKALRDLGIKLADCVRNIDYAGRLSEYEFLIVLPETDVNGATALIEKIEGILDTTQVQTQSGETVNCGIRYGFAQWTGAEDASTLLDKAAA